MRDYFIAVVLYLKKNLPFNDEILQHAEVADISKRMEKDFRDLRYFIHNFPCLNKSPEEVDEINMQFLAYQTAELPVNILDKKRRIDERWAELGEITNGEGKKLYDQLSKLMLVIVSIPHSNAECERLFSMVRKTKTEMRGHLEINTLNSILVHKCNMLARGTRAHQFDPSPSILAECKSATHAYNSTFIK